MAGVELKDARGLSKVAQRQLAPHAVLSTQQLHALGNRITLYQVFRLLEELPLIPEERFTHLVYLERLYMRSQQEPVSHPQFVLRRFGLVQALSQRHPDYPLFCRWREVLRWLRYKFYNLLRDEFSSENLKKISKY